MENRQGVDLKASCCIEVSLDKYLERSNAHDLSKLHWLTGLPNGKAADFNTVHDVSLHYTGRGKGGKGDAAEAAPPDAVIQEIDAQGAEQSLCQQVRHWLSATMYRIKVPIALF